MKNVCDNGTEKRGRQHYRKNVCDNGTEKRGRQHYREKRKTTLRMCVIMGQRKEEDNTR